jgi:hypothetical protein
VPSGRVWIGREHEFEEFIRTAPIVRVRDLPAGVTRSVRAYFAPGGLAGSVVFKTMSPRQSRGYFESYKSEIAAYRLDRLLGLGMVPPTVERRVRDQVGSAQLWVERCSPARTKAGTQAPDPRAWNRQVHRQRVWDNLIANLDRNQGNLLVDDAWNLVLIDHSRAFTGVGGAGFEMTRIDRPLYERLKTLTRQEIENSLAGLLLDGPGPLLRRRDAIVAHFEQLIAEKGEQAVMD